MAKYVYEGRAPADDGDGGLLRPLDEREFDADPGWPWRELEKPAEPPESPPGPKVALPAATAAVSSTAPPKPGTTED